MIAQHCAAELAYSGHARLLACCCCCCYVRNRKIFLLRQSPPLFVQPLPNIVRV